VLLACDCYPVHKRFTMGYGRQRHEMHHSTFRTRPYCVVVIAPHRSLRLGGCEMSAGGAKGPTEQGVLDEVAEV
jgi:hypothetical protein